MNWETVKLVAVLSGIILAFVCVSSAAWNWVKKQVFGYPGSVLCGSGVVFIGLSIWSHIDVQLSPNDGMKMNLSEIEGQIVSLRNDIAQLQTGTNAVSGTQFDALQKKISEISSAIKEENLDPKRKIFLEYGTSSNLNEDDYSRAIQLLNKSGIAVYTIDHRWRPGNNIKSLQLTPPNPTEQNEVKAETLMWDAMKDTGSVADFASYLKEYPNGAYSDQARNRINALSQTPSAPSLPGATK